MRVTTAPAPTNAWAPTPCAAHDRRVGADGRAPADQGRAELVLARHVAPRVHHVGEHRARTAEDVVLQRDALVHRHVVLDLHAVADHDGAADEHVLAEHAVAAEARRRHDVAEVPDARTRADDGARVHHSRRVDERRRAFGGRRPALRVGRARPRTGRRLPRPCTRRRSGGRARAHIGRRPRRPGPRLRAARRHVTVPHTAYTGSAHGTCPAYSSSAGRGSPRIERVSSSA